MKHKIVFIIMACLIIPLSGTAQSHLKIKSVFDSYGKQEGSVYVQLSTDVLSQGSKITLYKSLITSSDEEKSKTIMEAVEADIQNSDKISEMKKNGLIESGTYYLKDKSSSKENEYLLYKHNPGKITVVYLKGKFPPSELDSELKNLKNLIIYINNKRIKLQ